MVPVLSLFLVSIFHLTTSAPARPNILFVLADDLGYGEFETFPANSPNGRMATPRTNKFASQSITFTSSYAGEAVCAPSRCTLMTGLHTGHCTIRGNGGPDLQANPNDKTIAQILLEAGYDTALVGKWGLGNNGSTGAPWVKGFQYYYGQTDQNDCHNYFPPVVWESHGNGNTGVGTQTQIPENKNASQSYCTSPQQPCVYSTSLYTQKSIDYILTKTPTSTPWFLYTAYTTPHAGGFLTDDAETGQPVPSEGTYANQSTWPDVERGHAAAITDYLDKGFGQILDALDSAGVSNNTIVFWTSDNGPHNEGGHKYTFFNSNGPLKGFKRSLYEGGIRVPTFVRWPGQIKENTTSNYAWAFWDFLPTAAELAGVDGTTLPPHDGLSIVPTLLGQKQDAHEYLYWEFCTNNQWGHALRSGDWKAVSFNISESFELYNLTADLGETKNVAAQNPDVIAQMNAWATEAHTDSAAWPIDPCHTS